MLNVRVALRCDAPGCLCAISYSGGSGTNASGALDIASREYGWAATTATARCFVHRQKPLAFHDYVAGKRDNDPCAVCGAYDDGAKRGSVGYRPQHREKRIRANVDAQAAEPVQEWRHK